MELEACIEGYDELLVAIHNGFKRVELCSALSLGGLSPSDGLIDACCSKGGIEVHVMVRPRPGDFNYSIEEVKMMRHEIKRAARLGAKGVVFGILDENNQMALENIPLIRLAKRKGLEVTFHRAFDLLDKPFEALRQLKAWNVDRLLTSGGEQTALKGLKRIKDLQEQSEGAIQIMAGSGVHPDNMQKFIDLGLEHLHMSIAFDQHGHEWGFGPKRMINIDKINALRTLLKAN